MKKVVLALCLSWFVLGPVFAADDEVETAVSMDVYKKIREGTISVETDFVEKRVAGVGAKLNELACPKTGKNCFDAGKDMTYSDIQKILSNDITTLKKYLTDDFKNDSTTEQLSSLVEQAQSYLKTTITESRDDISMIEGVGGIGVYTDGSLGNSPFDLLYDLQEIKKIILADKKKYDGTKNTVKDELKAYLQSKGASSKVGNKDGIVPQTCKGSFCIAVDSVSNKQQNEGMSKKDDTIEGIINTVYDIVIKNQGTSLVQAKMTKNFFEATFNNLKLPKLANLSTQVSTATTSIFKKKDAAAEAAKTDAQKEDDKGELSNENLWRESFDEMGMDYKKQNNLGEFEKKIKVDCGLGDVTGLLVQETIEKCEKAKRETTYSNQKTNTLPIEDNLQKKYYGSFEKEIMEFNGIATTLREGVDYLVGVISRTYDTKCKN